jgi:hypothetical protein
MQAHVGLHKEKRDWWLTPVILTTWEADSRRISSVQDQPGKYFLRPYLQHNQSKMDKQCGSSSRTPALQVFKLQSHQKKKKKRDREGERKREIRKKEKKTLMQMTVAWVWFCLLTIRRFLSVLFEHMLFRNRKPIICYFKIIIKGRKRKM